MYLTYFIVTSGDARGFFRDVFILWVVFRAVSWKERYHFLLKTGEKMSFLFEFLLRALPGVI